MIIQKIPFDKIGRSSNVQKRNEFTNNSKTKL